ncbi:MAG: hypothetical protein V4538_10260 [Bacteroidota bacterium]
METKKQPIKFVREALSESTIILYSDKPTKEIYEELKSALVKSNQFLNSPNINGNINDDYTFHLTHKWETFTQNFGGMAAEMEVQIFDYNNRSKIIINVKPNSFFCLLFLAFFIGGLLILLWAIITSSDEHDSFLTAFFALFIACPILVLGASVAKQVLVNTFEKEFYFTR